MWYNCGMNIEYTGKYDAVAAKRFAGKVFDRVARGMSVFCYAFLVLCAAFEVFMLVRWGVFNYYLLAIAGMVLWSIRFQRARYQKNIDILSRRYLTDSDEATVVMTDDSYECRCGTNQMRVAWRNLGAYYLFVDDGVVLLMDGKVTTLLLPSLSKMGVQAGELKDALERAGLKDFCKCRSYFWLFVLIICCICGAAAFFDFARSRPQIPACVSCIAEEDEDDDEDEDEGEEEEGGSFSLGDVDFDDERVYLSYSLSDVRSSTNKQQISYQDFANIVAVLREQKSRKSVYMFLSIGDVAGPARPLDTLATLTNSNLSVDLVFNDCTNLADVAALGRVPLKELTLIRCPIREIRGLESCPIESLTVWDCPISSFADICPLPRLKRMDLKLKGQKCPSKEELLSRWGMLDLFSFHESDSEDAKPVVIPLFSETERFQSAVAGADRVVIRDGGYGCCSKPEDDPVLLVLTDTQEISDFRALFKFEDKGENGSCMCCGHPGIDWWKGDVLVARTAVQHLQGLRWKGFYGDAELTSEARKTLDDWFSKHNVKAKK